MMSGDYWESEVYAAEPLVGLERRDMAAVFDWIERSLPISGARIDWSMVRGEHSHRQIVVDVQLVEVAATEVCRRIGVTSGVEHVGDSLSPYGLRFTDDNASAIVTALLEIPEHHYFLDEGRSWLVVISSEGDLDIVDHLEVGNGL